MMASSAPPLHTIKMVNVLQVRLDLYNEIMGASKIIIKLGYQNQAGKAVFLHENGLLVCGKFQYKSISNLKKFKNYFKIILDLTDKKPKQGVLDVSHVTFWDAISIYDNYVVTNWVANVSARKLEKFANETQISIIRSDIEPIFKQALVRRWRSVFKKYDLDDPSIPRESWQIL